MPAGMPPAPMPMGLGAAAAPLDFFSTITACVVSMMPAIPHALLSALLVTCNKQAPLTFCLATSNSQTTYQVLTHVLQSQHADLTLQAARLS